MVLEIVKRKEKSLLSILGKYGIADEKNQHLCLQELIKELFLK